MKGNLIFQKAKGAKRFLGVLLCFVLLLSMSPRSVLVAEARETPIATLFFASDYQDESGDGFTPSTTLTSILRQAKSDGKNIDHAVFCGDFSIDGYNYFTNVVADINAVKGIVDTELGEGVLDTYLQGNHDLFDSGLMSTTGAHEYDNYILYVINTQGGHTSTGGNPWNQGSTNSASIVQAAANDLQSYLNGRITAGDTRPIFIATHVPLHMTSRTSSLYSSGDNMYSSYLFDVINTAGSNLDIVFLYGHNHSHGWDSYIGGSSVYLTKGDTIYIPDSTNASGTTDKFTEKTLTFTYMNAGYLGYNTGSTADSALTGTVVEIYGNELVITRYDTSGIHNLGAAGSYNTASDEGIYSDANGFGSGQSYACVAQDTDSPQSVALQNTSSDPVLRLVGASSTADIANSDTVTAVLSNAVGASDVTYTWTTTDESIARLLSNSGETVTVDYLKAGTATITCAASFTLDGEEKSIAKAYTVTVTAEVFSGSGKTYTLVTSETDLSGSGYLILYNDGYIVEPSVTTTDSRTGLVANQNWVSGAGNATLTGDYSAYEWTLNVNSSSSNKRKYWTVQGSNVSGNNYLRFSTSSNYPASFAASGSASRFRITFGGSYATFKYTNSSTNDYTSLSNLMQKSTSRGIVYGYDSSAGTTNFYLYKASGTVVSDPSMNIITADGNEPAASYDEATTAIFKATVENIGEITSYAWTSSDESVISFSNRSAASPTVNFLKDGEATVSLTLTYVESGVEKTLTDSVTITVNDTSMAPKADILRGSQVVTNVMQRRYSVTSLTADQLTASYSGINNAAVSWTSSNTQVASVSSNGVVSFTGNTGYTSITMTVTGTDTEGNPVTLSRIVSYYADSGSASAPTNDYPSYPDEGSVKIDKYASSVDFASTGVAEVTLEMDGISSTKPLDIVIVLDMSSSMDAVIDTQTRVQIMNTTLHKMVDDLLSDNPDGTTSENRLSFIAFNNYDYTKIGTDNTIGGYDPGTESTGGFNYTGEEGSQHPILSLSGENPWDDAASRSNIHTAIDLYITEEYTTSGTNYDLAFLTAYRILESAKAEANYNRDQIVIFLSDGCPFQWNYFRGYSGNGQEGKGTTWMTWLDGSYVSSASGNSYESQYFNEDGKNWWAEAIKSTTGNNKVIDPYGGMPEADGSSTATDPYISYVDGLGATIYSLGYCLAQDGEIAVSAQQEVIRSVASSDDKVYYVNNGEELGNAFSKITGSLSYAATDTVVTDTLGQAYNLQISSLVHVGDMTIDLSDPEYIGKAPYIEFGTWELNAERHKIPNSYAAVETVTFETDASGALAAAYTSLNPGANIYNSSTGIIDAVNFDYNITTETFTWNVGTLYDNARYELSYFVFLTGAREGEREAGSYPTNLSAVVDYTNYLGHDAQQVFPVPYIPWKAANITYELYLVNANGQPINENGIVVPFASRVVYYTNTLTVLLNNQNEVPASEIVAADAAPEGYELFNRDTAYFISIGSGSNVSYAYVCDDGTPETSYVAQTTFVYQPAGASYTGGTYSPSGSEITYNLKVDGLNDYSNTHVAFAVVAVPELTERTVLKVWDHGENPEESRPASVTVQLKANGENYGKPIVLNASNSWSYTWKNLNRYVYSNGVATDSEVVYSIEETAVPEGYTVSYSPAEESGLITVKNTYSTVTYYALQITKTNDSEPTEYLNGAGFRLYIDEFCTTEVAEYYLDAAMTQKVSELADTAVVTDSTGKISFYALVAGEYYIYEFRAPTGYERLSAPLKLTIAEDGTATVTTASGSYEATVSENNTISITLTNRTLNVDIPFTAGMGAYGYVGIGVLLMGTACVLLAVIRRRRNSLV